MTAASAAQFGLPRQLSRRAPLASDPSGALPDYDGGFRFCRVWFRNGSAGDGDGWYVDYPRADENLSIRLMELTTDTGDAGWRRQSIRRSSCG